MKKPEKMPNPAEAALDKFKELDFDFPEAGAPEDVGMPELPEMPMKPMAPAMPELALPEQAMADVEIPSADLPIEIFDIV